MRLQVDWREWRRVFVPAGSLMLGIPVVGALAMLVGAAFAFLGVGMLFLPVTLIVSACVSVYFFLPGLIVPGLVEVASPFPILLPTDAFGWGYVIAFYTAIAVLMALVASLYVQDEPVA